MASIWRFCHCCYCYSMVGNHRATIIEFLIGLWMGTFSVCVCVITKLMEIFIKNHVKMGICFQPETGWTNIILLHTHTNEEKTANPTTWNSSFFVDWPLLHRQFCYFLFLASFLLWFFLRTNGIVWTTEQSVVELQIKMLRGIYDFISISFIFGFDFNGFRFFNHSTDQRLD